MVRFDAYSATTTFGKPEQLLETLVGSIPGLTYQRGKGFHRFADRIGVKDASGAEIGSVMWGGMHGERMMIEVKGERSPEVVERIRRRHPHRCTRVDACADFDAPGAFESLLRSCMKVKKANKLRGSRAGDWQDYPELGRTQYLGAETSPVRVRLYEKGKQPEYRHLERNDWVRLEVQVRPSKEAKEEFSGLSAVDVWGAADWSRKLAGEVLAEHIDPHPAGTVWKHSKREAALRWMCKQYGPHLVGLAGDLGGWAEVGLTLREMLQEAGKST